MDRTTMNHSYTGLHPLPPQFNCRNILKSSIMNWYTRLGEKDITIPNTRLFSATHKESAYLLFNSDKVFLS